MLNAIKTCPYCHGRVIFTNNAQLYGRPYGGWPYIYLCLDCKASVGCQYQSDLPLGRMTKLSIAGARRMAHQAFDALWQSGRMSRKAAYTWLAAQLGIEEARCHIGKFTIDECHYVVELCKALEPKR